MKKYIADNNINFYTIDGMKLGKEIGLGGRINTILQSAFFSIANIIPADEAIQYMKDAATKSYSKKGEKIVAMNHAAIDRGAAGRTTRSMCRSLGRTAVDESEGDVAIEGNADFVEYVKNF